MCWRNKKKGTKKAGFHRYYFWAQFRYYQQSKTTKRFHGPWKLLWALECPDRSSAMKLERRIKKRGIGRYLLELNR